MASSAPKVAAEERFETPNAIDQKAQVLADLISKSNHFIVFTGAGISTSAGQRLAMAARLSASQVTSRSETDYGAPGIPDFRGPDGAWTLRAQGRQRTSKTVSTLQAIPTPTHMALAELAERGILKYLISQNCDGLHRKSGIHPVSVGLYV